MVTLITLRYFIWNNDALPSCVAIFNIFGKFVFTSNKVIGGGVI